MMDWRSCLIKAALGILTVLLIASLVGCGTPCGMFLSPDGKHIYSYRCNP